MGQGSRSHPVPSCSMDKLPHLRHTTDPGLIKSLTLSVGNCWPLFPPTYFTARPVSTGPQGFPLPSPSLAPSLQLPFAPSPCSGLAPSPFQSPRFPQRQQSPMGCLHSPRVRNTANYETFGEPHSRKMRSSVSLSTPPSRPHQALPASPPPRRGVYVCACVYSLRGHMPQAHLLTPEGPARYYLRENFRKMGRGWAGI